MSKRYKVRCPGCGKTITGTRKSNEYKKSFECDICTTRFHVTLEYPDQGELLRRFLFEDEGATPFDFPSREENQPPGPPVSIASRVGGIIQKVKQAIWRK